MSIRILTQAVAVPGPQVVRRRRWVKPRTNLTAQMVRSAGRYRSGLSGVKHHQPVPFQPASSIVAGRRRITPVGTGPVERVRPEPAHRGAARAIAWPGSSRSGWFARFQDDRDLTGLKVAVVGLVIVIVMLLEVPW